MEHAAAETETNAKSPGAFRTIREVSESLDVPQHVLRFWETRFPQVKPLKRGGGRRYYRPEDVALLHRIRALLYADGYTIRGVQKLLREKGAKGILSMEPAAPASASDARPPIEIDDAGRERFESLMKELVTLRDMLRGRVPPG